MTTIATDGRTMAADSRGCANELIRNDAEKKLHRLKDGRVVGASGTITAARAYIRWLEEGGERPKIEGAFSAIVLNPNGSAQIHYNDDEPDDLAFPAAIGSGTALALGAMLAGASPAEAVAIAAKRDPFTGGTITEMSL